MAPNSIYKITNVFNDKVYVGQTWSTLAHRWGQHTSGKKVCIKLCRALDKYGKSNFKIELITIAHTQEVANHWETYFIKRYDSIKNGYNIREGGSRGKHSEETKIKMSAAAMGNKNGVGSKGCVGRVPWNKNKPHSDEHKQSLRSVSKKGKTWKLVDGKRVWT